VFRGFVFDSLLWVVVEETVGTRVNIRVNISRFISCSFLLLCGCLFVFCRTEVQRAIFFEKIMLIVYETFICLCVLFLSICFSLDDVGLARLKLKVRDEFDWTAYLEMNPDISRHYSTREGAAEHYINHGHKEGRVFPSLYPNQPSLSTAMKKLMNFCRIIQRRNIPVDQRTFIIFHVGIIDSQNSLEVVINNLRIFNFAMRKDATNSHNFYWFNIIGGKDNNMVDYLPSDNQWNVVKLEWLVSPSDILMHLRTLNVVKHTLQIHFGSVMFLNNGVRGPMMYREDGQWVNEFRKLLSDEHHVGMAGPTLSCEVAPHIQTHFLIMRTRLVPALIQEYTTFHRFDDWPELIRHYEVGMSQFIMRHGWNISSLMYSKRLNKTYFDGYCIPVTNAHRNGILNNPSRWCDVQPEELIMYKFGGEMLRVSGFVCEDVRRYMRDELIRLHGNEMKNEQLILPETLKGGPTFDLFKQYDLEIHHDHLSKELRKTQPVVNRRDETADKVCLLVRTAKMHEIKQSSPYGESVASGSIDEIVACKSILFVFLYIYFSYDYHLSQ
jgi:hypothetical protein